MLSTYAYPEFPYVPSEEQRTGRRVRHPVVVVGAGPVGLTAALDCAHHGVPVVVLDDNSTVSVGSRAVCYAKRPLEIWDRLGCAQRLLDKGVIWKNGKVFRHDRLIYQFDLLPEDGHRMPAFINLQQYYLEEYLIDHAHGFDDRVDLRWKHQVADITPAGDHVRLTVETPDGFFDMEADWAIACDGARSDIREALDLPFAGQAFQDRFLITDVVMKADFPAERWFWFDPPFHRGQSVLLHMQADNVWRIDFQLGMEADPEQEKRPERVIPRLKRMLGEDTAFDLEWVSVYQFACRRLEDFRHGRVLFAGDAAHQVSPFGARGANTGIQDVDNLIWKLALVLRGQAPERLLDSYSEERVLAARENLLTSTRSTDFISPKSTVSRAFRDATLDLAEHLPFARPLVNSGRLSRPTPYTGSSLNTADTEPFTGAPPPGTNAADAPVTAEGAPDWLLRHLGDRFVALLFLGEETAPPPDHTGTMAALAAQDVPIHVVTVGRRAGDLVDGAGLAHERYDATAGTTVLVRPDQVIAGRWRGPDPARLATARDRAIARA
ncbi:FAD-dependent oxidoreductase [Roseospira visakhapatnamensis]|uniref:3-(3-hydroxy-phenyl)propionate hydroxylase n=1 Tax=Roseospira visakhapatnamensis TaxID=390880 RepID=A0A7W6RBJ5_9PROT|nr:FAD-dependent oxidoreductase [Roseospira visakhapatnamensis]MBB4264853.1 3-(3-hydroxy-phenyl)propionate hydroxylase [Roseospira visakhapatnamensis]